MVNFKTVNNSDAGTSTKHGGNDADRISQVYNGLPDIAPYLDINTQMRIRSGRLELRNAANSFSYTIIGAALTANWNLLLPLLTAHDTLMVLNHPQEMTNKTISGLSNTIEDLPPTALPTELVYEDEPNTFSQTNTFTAAQKFDDYTQIKAIAAPASPATGFAYLYLDTADNKYKIKKSDGSEIDLEAIGAGAATDDRVMIREAGIIVGTQSRKLNFVTATDFDLTEDAANDEIELKIADNAVRDNHVNAHTSTKITITNKSQLNTNIGYKDENDWVTDSMVAPHTTSKIITSSKSLLNNQIAYKDETGWLTAAMIAGALPKTALPSSILYNDQNNNLGAFYHDVGAIAEPPTPAAQTARAYFDIADEHYKVKKSSGSVVDLESAGTGGGGGGGGMAAGGMIQKSGDATTTVFNIPHGLSPTPELYWAEPASDDAIGNIKQTITSTNIVVTYAVPPPSGSLNLTYHWAAGYINSASGGFTPTSTTEMSNKTIGDFLDFVQLTTPPAAPAAGKGRLYTKQIDANNDGLFWQGKKAGAIVEVRVL